MVENRSEPGPLADFGGLLRRFRRRAGLTQEALAEKAGLSVGGIRLLETGRRRHPRPETIAQLVAALELPDADARQLRAAARRPTSNTSDGQGIPSQLPPAVVDFTGRSEELSRLAADIRPRTDRAAGVPIAVISGMGGIGKTTLAVQAGHAVAAEFPAGQIAVNLRGGGTEPRSTEDALRYLLQALGVPPVGTSDVQVLANRYRTALAGQRMLIILDDAADVAQVTPLIPGTPSAAVIITSRQRLGELPGAQHFDLGVLGEREALELLGEVVGPAVIASYPEAASRIVQRCGGLPLAIRIAGGQSHSSGVGLQELAAQLAEDAGRLDALTGPDGVVSKTIRLSLAALSTGNEVDVAAAGAFPVFALLDGDWFPLRAAAKVLGKPIDDTEVLLERLVDLHLLETPALHRYRLHDLVRDIGRDLARTAQVGSDLPGAFHRELECYLAVLWRYAELGDEVVDLYGTWTDSSWSADAADLSDRQHILEWLEAELPNLVRLVGAAAAGDAGERLTAVRIALGMSRLSRALMRFGEFHAVMSVVIDLPVALDLRLEHGRIYQMAAALSWLGMSAEALQWSDIELPLARAIGEPTQLSASLVDRSSVLLRLNRPDEAMPYAEEALRVVLETGALTHEAGANLSVGMLAGQLGDLPRQREAFGRAIQILSGGAPTSAALAHALVGWSFRDSGQYEASLASLDEALELSRETRTEALEAMILTELGATWLAMGDHARAAEALTDGLAIAIRYPREHREAELRQRLGQALVGLGMVAEARAEWERAIVLYDRMADSRAAEVRESLTGSAVER